MSAQLPYAHAADRIAGGFNWAEQMDSLYGKQDSLYNKATFTSADAGRANYVYGEVLWQQANTKTPLWGLLPKVAGDQAPSNIDDPRPLTYRVAFNPPGMTGVAEGGNWGDAVTFDTRQIEVTPKTDTILFENTVIQDLFAQIQDGVPFDNLVQIGEEYFQRALEVEGLARAMDSGTSYANDLHIAPLDRVISSADEEANSDDTSATAFAGGEADVYSIDRSDTGAGGDNEANWADAVVDHNGIAGDRQLTTDLINGVVQSLEDNGADREDLVMFTGNDTARVISDLKEDSFDADALSAAARANVGRGSDQGETTFGVAYNDRLQSYNGIPIVTGPNVPSDSLSRIYFLDMSTMQDPVTGQNVPKLFIETYIPMFTEQAGLGEQTNTLALGSLKNQVGVGVTQELRCIKFDHQAKLRDLAE